MSWRGKAVYGADGTEATEVWSPKSSDVTLADVHRARQSFESDRTVNHGRSNFENPEIPSLSEPTKETPSESQKGTSVSTSSEPKEEWGPKDFVIFDEEYLTKLHWKEKKKDIKPEDDWPRRCRLCNIKIANMKIWINHIKGKRHREMKYRATPKQQRKAPKKVIQRRKELRAITRSKAFEQRAKEAKTIKYKNRETKELKKGCPTTCNVCNKTIKSWADWGDHIASKKHKKKVKAASMRKQENSEQSQPADAVPIQKPAEPLSKERMESEFKDLTKEWIVSLSKTGISGKRPLSQRSDVSQEDFLGEPVSKKARIEALANSFANDDDAKDDVANDDLNGNDDDESQGTESTADKMDEDAPSNLSNEVNEFTKTSQSAEPTESAKSNESTRESISRHFGPTYFTMIRYEQPEDLTISQNRYLIAREIPRAHSDAMLFQNLFDSIIGHKCTVDIQLFHNRHHSKLAGFGLFYFERLFELNIILQASRAKKLIFESSGGAETSLKFECALCGIKVQFEKQLEIHKNGKRHRENLERMRLQKGTAPLMHSNRNRGESSRLNGNIVLHQPPIRNSSDWMRLWTPSEIAELGTDDKLEGKTNLIRISNLHWKCTLRHIEHVLNALYLETNPNKIDTKSANDLDPRWMKLLEDNKGYPRGVALVMLKSPKMAKYCIDQYNGRRLLGRKMVMEYSSFKVDTKLATFRRPKYDSRCRLDAEQGTISRVLLSNLKADCTEKDVIKFVERTMGEMVKDVIKFVVKDVHLLHNVQRRCGGKCYVQFRSVLSAQQFMECLEQKDKEHGVWMSHRSVEAKYEDRETVKDRKELADRTKQLMVSNFSFKATEEALKRIVGGNPESVEIVVDLEGCPTGDAILDYKTSKEASTAYTRWMRAIERGSEKILSCDRRALKLTFYKRKQANTKRKKKEENKEKEEEDEGDTAKKAPKKKKKKTPEEEEAEEMARLLEF